MTLLLTLCLLALAAPMALGGENASARDSELDPSMWESWLNGSSGMMRAIDRVSGERKPMAVYFYITIDPDLKVGLVQGVDDATGAVLRGLLGTKLTLLTDDLLALGDLSEFDSIVVDIRAFRRRERGGAFRRLLDFSSLPGRRLVVFYHKDSEFNPGSSGFVGAPHQPFRIGRGRVTQEDAPVRMLVPDHPVLSHPNKIGPDDWDGWEQERGLYFPELFDDAYVPLLAMADQGQPEETGALLYARNGRGEYVYCALALWRQLKNLHPGAVRLFVNLITPGRPE